MYSTIPKDKIDKQVIDFNYKLFVLLIISIEAPPYRAQSHWLLRKIYVIGCSTG